MAGSGAQAVLLHFDPVCAEFKLGTQELFFTGVQQKTRQKKMTFSATTEI